MPPFPAAAAMPSSALWAVDLFGRVHVLSTAGQSWELCRDSQLEFKRVSAATQCCWGLAGDNQVYVYVRASDVPIRRQEEAYENQVGSPVFGLLAGGLAGRGALRPRVLAESHHLLGSELPSAWGQSPCCALTKAGWPGPHEAGLPAGSRGAGRACPPLPAPRGAGSRGSFSPFGAVIMGGQRPGCPRPAARPKPMPALGPQRWNPVGGFCEKLLPSDRWPWSDVSGLQPRPLDGVALPSPHWEWESDWHVDENFGGEPTEKGVGGLASCPAPTWGGRFRLGPLLRAVPSVPWGSTLACALRAPHLLHGIGGDR